MSAGQIIVAVSVLGGIIGGMGMGGGTLLIPLLTLSAGLEQHLAQSINLIAFIPMSVTALVMHGKNGYVNVKQALPITVLALIGAVCGSFGAKYSGGYELRAAFGAFLILLGAYQLIKTVCDYVKSKKQRAESSAKKPIENANA